MLRINKVVFISVLIFTQLSLMAQNNTSSPYTRFGYGDLADRSFAAGRAMGGVGVGLRSPKQINPMNPASYSCMDSLTFLFDFGASGQVSWFNDDVNKQKNLNGNVEYIAMQFPITRRLAVSLGLLPYSHVGYEFGKAYTEVDAPYVETYKGAGSLSDLYGGLAYDIWKKRLSVGANFGFLFGNLEYNRDLTFSTAGAYNTSYVNRLEVRDLKMDFGIQYTHPLDKHESVTVGVTYSPGKKLHTTFYDIEQMYSSSSSSSSLVSYNVDTLKNARTEIPHTFGVGLSYVKDNKLTVAADFLYENWAKCLYMDEEGHFKNRVRVAAGAEYIPDYSRRLYFNRIRYRVGAHYSNSYLNISMQEEDRYKKYGYNEYGASVGLGLPLIDNRSFINISFEYVKIRPELRTMIDEQYFRFTVNYTFNEMWFRKRKID